MNRHLLSKNLNVFPQNIKNRCHSKTTSSPEQFRLLLIAKRCAGDELTLKSSLAMQFFNFPLIRIFLKFSLLLNNSISCWWPLCDLIEARRKYKHVIKLG